MLISFSTATFDYVNNRIFLGGPSNYGGVILDYLGQTKGLKFLNICNIAKEDCHRISTLTHLNFIPNYIKQSVNFSLYFKKNQRKVSLKSKPFQVSKNIFHELGLERIVKNSTVIVSPVIAEFTKSFFLELFRLKPDAIFLDLFNNDDGEFSKMELELLESIQNTEKTKLFFKLSQNEYFGLLQNNAAIGSNHTTIITKGDKGAEMKYKKKLRAVNGLKTQTVRTTGAGDVFIYTFAGLYDGGVPLKECLEKANKMAAQSTEFVKLEEFANDLKQRRYKLL